MPQHDPSAEVRARLRAQIAALEAGDSGLARAEGKRETARAFQGHCGETAGPAGREEAGTASTCRFPQGLPGRGCGERGEASCTCGPAADAADGAERAFRKIERLACARERATSALRRRLVREGFAEEDVDVALDRAVACGLVDDRRYADVLVRSRLAQGRGRRGIAAELADLGIDANGVAALTEDPQEGGDGAGELARAIAVLDRRPPRAKNLRDAAYRRLVQKGYGSSIASSAARLWCDRQAGREG